MATRAATRQLSIFLLLSAAWVVLSCVPALAHANLLEASPSEGSRLSTPPEQVELRFNEPVDAEFSPLEVRESDGNRVDEDDARVDPEDARVVLADLEELPEGSYDVEWRVTSIDGHVVQGKYGFAVADGAGKNPGVARDAARPGAGERAGQARGEPVQGGQDASAPILAYSALSLGALALVVVLVLLASKLSRRTKT